jgi:hypothetical protein
MFHLLVSWALWPEGGGALDNGRIYIPADESPGDQFYTNGALDAAKLARYPALLVHENGSDAPQIARVAHITNIVRGPRQTAIHYVIDNGIRPVANHDLASAAALLGIGKFNLSHTHWAVRDADLFRILLVLQQKQTPAPKVFSGDAIGQEENTLVSLMMPFAAEFDLVYRCISDAVKAIGGRCVRADNFWEHPIVMQDVFNLIARGRVVICDCSGRNPNVFYEAGIAHTLGKEVLLITQSKGDIPFDLRHLRYVHYLNNSEGRTSLVETLKPRLSKLLQL